MRRLDLKYLSGVAILLLGWLSCARVRAGGSGLNTIVIVNQKSSNSCALGNYFCERRQVPPENLIRIDWEGSNISWTSGDFQTNLLTPLLTALAERQLTEQIDLAVLSMDIPFQTVTGTSINSTTSALLYGAKNDSGPEWNGITNSYFASETVFHKNKPASAPGYSFLATMLTGNTLAEAKQIVDQGANSDGTFPSGVILLAKNSDPIRNVRFHAFDNAIFNARIRGNLNLQQTNLDSLPTQGSLGVETGLASFSVALGTFVPGAIADSLTSFGGVIFGPNGQTSLLEFLRAGASASYGTVTEPSPDPNKFPDPQVYFYQSRGFGLAECYYQSLFVPFQGLIVGEPLAAPFAYQASPQWVGTASNAVLTGNAPLGLHFSSDRDHPIQQVDLFVDGKMFQTLTNIPPQPGNLLNLSLNHYSVSYMVSSNDTLGLIASNLSALINAPTATNATQIIALTHGDRIELRCISTNGLARPSPPTNLRRSTESGATSLTNVAGPTAFSIGSVAGSAGFLSTFLRASRNYLMGSPALGLKKIAVSGTIQVGSWLQLNVTKTNGAVINLGVTNQSTSATPFNLCDELTKLLNATPGLQTLDGIKAEDLIAGWSGAASFNLYARAAGYAAARANVILTGSGNFVITPSTPSALDDNLSDLQPRDHLYITGGATNVAFTFPLDTTALADGFHDLTAVAYEGSHVRTQTRITLPVQIQNARLTASLSSLDLTNSASAQGEYHIQVVANTNTVAAITLFSTGGILGMVTNQNSATFTVDGSILGEGLHPFYAILESVSGDRYRTEPLWIRLSD